MHATDATLPYGVVSSQTADRWAVILLPSLEVVGDRRYATREEAMTAAAELRDRAETEARAYRNFDEIDLQGDGGGE